MTSEQSVLRTTLLPSLLEAADRNREVGNEDVALFELARVYLPGGEGEPRNERWHVGGVLEGGYLDAKGVVDALLAALKIEAGFGRGSHTASHPGKTAELGARRASSARRTPRSGRGGRRSWVLWARRTRHRGGVGGVRARPGGARRRRVRTGFSTRTS